MRPVRYFPEDWATLRGAIYTWVAGEAALLTPTPRVTWKEQRGPSPVKPYIAIGFIALAVREGQDDKLTRLALRVTAATPLATYGATVGDVEVEWTAPDPVTVADVRNALVDAFNAAAPGSAVAAYPDAFELDLAGAVALVGPLEPRVSVWALNDGLTTLSVDVFSDVAEDATDLDPAVPIAGALEMSLGKPSVHTALSAAGWAPLSVITGRRAPLPIGRGWENRAGFDLRLRSRMRARELAYWLEYFDGTSHTGSLSA